ncbi:hypothetical protein HK096_011543, partial [Nowakowskiella sp. JEL0078]
NIFYYQCQSTSSSITTTLASTTTTTTTTTTTAVSPVNVQTSVAENLSTTTSINYVSVSSQSTSQQTTSKSTNSQPVTQTVQTIVVNQQTNSPTATLINSIDLLAGGSTITNDVNAQIVATSTSESTITIQAIATPEIPTNIFIISGIVLFAVILIAGTLVYSRRKRKKIRRTESTSTVGWEARLSNMKNGSVGDISLQPMSETLNSTTPQVAGLWTKFTETPPSTVESLHTTPAPYFSQDPFSYNSAANRSPITMHMKLDQDRSFHLSRSPSDSVTRTTAWKAPNHIKSDSDSSQATVFTTPKFQNHFNPMLDPNTPPVAPPPSMPVPPTPKSPGRVLVNPFGAQMESLATIQREQAQMMSTRLAQVAGSYGTGGYVGRSYGDRDGGYGGN